MTRFERLACWEDLLVSYGPARATERAVARDAGVADETWSEVADEDEVPLTLLEAA